MSKREGSRQSNVELETQAIDAGSRYDPPVLAGDPVVGIVAQDDRLDEILRTTVRALDHGFEVLITASDPDESEVVRLAERLGARVVTQAEGTSDPELLKSEIVAAAGEQSVAGITFPTSDFEWIDYDITRDRMADAGFVVEPETIDTRPTVRVLVAIPAYNVEATIAEIVRSAKQHADEVLVIDDGSTDDTANTAREAGARVVSHRRNRGYGAALKTAFSEASLLGAETLVTLDGDSQHDPAEIPRMIERLETGEVDLVVGNRFDPESGTTLPFYRRVGLGVVNVLTNLSMANFSSERWIRDTQNGFRAYSRPVTESLAKDDGIDDHMDASIDILYHAKRHGYIVDEVEATVDYNVDGTSNHNPLYHGLVLVHNILSTVERDHPILLLGLPGFVLSIAALFGVYLTITNYITTGSFPLGMGLVSAVVLLIGIFSCFTAIILHSIQAHLR